MRYRVTKLVAVFIAAAYGVGLVYSGYMTFELGVRNSEAWPSLAFDLRRLVMTPLCALGGGLFLIGCWLRPRIRSTPGSSSLLLSSAFGAAYVPLTDLLAELSWPDPSWLEKVALIIVVVGYPIAAGSSFGLAHPSHSSSTDDRGVPPQATDT